MSLRSLTLLPEPFAIPIWHHQTVPHSDDLRYQVFVSSTFRDLQEERQKVLQAILEVQAFPAGMELFPAADDDQFDFIKREILSSDYYIVIVAGKYGSVARRPQLH